MAPSAIVGLYQPMFNVAIPAIRTHYGIQADAAAWVVTVYTLPFMMFMPLYGRLGDAFGKRLIFLIGLGIFMVGTIVAAFAPALSWLMIGRAIQGTGTAGFVPLAMAVIAQLYPAGERGKLMGTWNLVYPLTGLVAPVLGGFIIDYLGWRAIFWPILLGSPLAIWAVRHKIPPLPGFADVAFLRRFDWGGVLLLSATITSLLFYASSRPITGVEPLRDWRLLLVTLLVLSAFVLWERRRVNPYVPLEIFANRTFTLASLCAGIRMFTMGGLRFLVALYLIELHGLRATAAGLVITAHAVPLLLLLRAGGQLADRWGSRWPVVISFLAQTAALSYLALLPEEATTWQVVLGVLGQSAGASISLAALHRISTTGVPKAQTGMATGLYSMVRFAGTVFGTALSGVVLQTGLVQLGAPLAAYQMAFWFVAGVTLVGAVLGGWLRA